jgi:hypothetical protein
MVGDDDRDESAKQLLASAAPTTPLRVARSLAEAGPGELVMVGRRGQALGPRELTRIKAASWAIFAASGITVGIVYGALFSPIAGVIAGVAIELFALLKLRHWPAFRSAMAQAAASQWEDGHAALLALERKRLPSGQRENVQVILAALESILGQPEKALDRLERAGPSLSGWRGYGARLLRCQADSVRAGALATLGRFEEARRASDQLAREADAAAGRRARARGDYLEMLVQMTELKIAAESDDPALLPDDDTLHRWARAALGRTRFGELLVSLAWAFARRGDEDMARHLLAEAPSRIPRWSLTTTSPRLDRWARERMQVWGIEGVES